MIRQDLSDAAKQQDASVEPAPSISPIQLLSEDTPPSLLTTTSPTKEDSLLTNMTTLPQATMVDSCAEAGPSRIEDGHDHPEPVKTLQTYQNTVLEISVPEESVPEDSMPGISMYPPPVSPTSTYRPRNPSLPMVHVPKSPTSPYRPRFPSLPMVHVPKSPTSVKPLTAKRNRRSWHPSHLERKTTPASPTKDSTDKLNRSDSVASSGASSACSASSATVQISQPGTDAQTSKGGHKRQESDPKYLRFMSAVSQSQRQVEPERYVGYPGLVAHMTESQSLIFRRFDDIHIRLLLYLQDQISQLESALGKLDDQNIGEKGMHNGTFREDVDPARVEIMERLRILVGEYDTMVLAFGRMQESKASEKAVGRLKDWLRKYAAAPTGRRLSTNHGAIARDELEWIDKTDDLANLSISTASSIVAVKESPLTRLFSTRKHR